MLVTIEFSNFSDNAFLCFPVVLQFLNLNEREIRKTVYQQHLNPNIQQQRGTLCEMFLSPYCSTQLHHYFLSRVIDYESAPRLHRITKQDKFNFKIKKFVIWILLCSEVAFFQKMPSLTASFQSLQTNCIFLRSTKLLCCHLLHQMRSILSINNKPYHK